MNLQLKFKIYEKYHTQSDAAKEFGIREDYLSRIVRGRKVPTDQEKQIIANKLQTKVADLFTEMAA